MDEYIKRDDAEKALEEHRRSQTMSMFGDRDLLEEYRNGVVGAMNVLGFVPAADVVPRAEVVNKICCEIEEEIVAALESNYRILKELDDGRCNDYVLEIVNRIKGKIYALREIERFVEELKKKYTDATDTNVGHK